MEEMPCGTLLTDWRSLLPYLPSHSQLVYLPRHATTSHHKNNDTTNKLQLQKMEWCEGSASGWKSLRDLSVGSIVTELVGEF